MIKTSATVPLQYDTGFSPFLASEFDEALGWLQRNGFDGIEICISEPKKVNIEELNKKLMSHNLGISTISTGQSRVLEGLNLTDDSSEIRDKAVERIREHIELSTKIGYPKVTIGLLRGLGDPKKKEQQMEYLHAAMEKCGEYAKQYGVMVMLEPINRYETLLLNSVKETMDFIDTLANSQNIGILFDTFHSNIEDPDICKAMEYAGNRLFHVHFADSNRHLPGEGHIDFKAVYDTLKKMNFNGYVSIETLNLPDRKTVQDKGYEALTRFK